MILSRQNSLIKLIKSLSDKKNRDRENLYVVDGIKMVNEAVLNGCEFYRVIATADCLDKISNGIGVEVEEVSKEIMEYASNDVSPQGVIAVCVKPKNEIISPKGKCLFLDGVSDPANVGAIIRTAAAAGYNDVYLSDSADCYSPKSVRASMSGIFKVRTHQGAKDVLLEKINLPFIIADMDGVDVFKGEFPKDFCLVIGNEARGVSEDLIKKAEYVVKIPMQNDMESLNASVSAGILMYALTKQ
ncbi:MAG: RNA methyltransferase [Clostridia bacterium]|nr:RNA methyltransferase [Clostridia bacterium]